MGLATTEGHAPTRVEDALEVRRNAGLFGLATLASAATAVAYGWRVASSGPATLWVLVALLAAVAAFYATAWYDARAPLLVADALGVRLRDGRDWHGVPWDEVADIVVHPRRGLLRDGEIEVVEVQGAGYLVPVGLATVCSSPDLAGSVRALTGGQAAVTVVGAPGDGAGDGAGDDAGEDPPDDAGDGPAGTAGDVGKATDAGDRARQAPADEEPALRPRQYADPAGPIEAAAEPVAGSRPQPRPVALVESARRAIRANVSRSRPASAGTAALSVDPDVDPDVDPEVARESLPEARELRGTRGRVDLVFEPLPRQPEEVAAEAAPIESWPAQPAEDPVIGPQLAAVRERSGTTVDRLAERTRIRPHVIEAIEVDDFAPCGGDFYARGHIRSLARVLGLDADDLVAAYDRRYAQAPVDARRVFEAELATGPHPSIRRTKGGPNWAALLGVVMVLAIIWGLGQFVSGAGADPAETPTTGTAQRPRADNGAGNGAGNGADNRPGNGSLAGLGAPTSNELVLRGVRDQSKVVVRDHTGTVRWKGVLSEGETKKLTVPGRATIVARHGDAVSMRVDGKKKGTVGDDDGRAKTVRGKH